MSRLGKRDSNHRIRFDIIYDLFATFIQCGDQNLQVKLKVDSKEKKDGCEGEFGEDAKSERIG